jgi:16S rRNA (guanine1207-N2)-methyltransferase
VLIIRKSVEFPSNMDYTDTYDLALPNRPLVEYYSIPGVFAHHRIDEGALALIDVVEASENDTLIDMGCGIGTVGLAIAKYYNPKHTIFVDSNVRALDCAKKNVELNKLNNCDFYLTDDGLIKKKATIFVGNPPYFSNFRIADLFIDNAYSNLAKGGTAYIVAKNYKHIHKAMLKVFGNANITLRRGYTVVSSTKS